MPLTQQNRTRLQRLCTELRAETWPTWDAAGTEAAILELDKQMPNDPLGVAVRALTAARNPANRGPATMLQEAGPEAVVRTITPAVPRRDDPSCGLHGSTIRDSAGEYVCCRQERIAGHPPRVSPTVPLSRPAGACPPEVKERIEAMRRESAVNRAKAESRAEAS